MAGDGVSNGFLCLLKDFDSQKEAESPSNSGLIDTTEQTNSTANTSKATLLAIEMEMMFEIVGSSLQTVCLGD